MTADDFEANAQLHAAGKLSRRKFMNRVVAGGMTASAAYAFLAATGSSGAAAASLAPTASVYGTAPGAPRNLTAAATGVGQVRLTWAAPASDGGSPILDYIVQRSPNGASGWATLNDGVGTGTSFTVTGLANGTKYFFRVLAKNALGTGGASNVASATTPAMAPSAPRSLQAAAGNGQVALSWLAPAANGGAAVADYIIQRSPNGSSGWVTINDGVRASTGYTVTGLSNGTRYFFRVLAKNAAGNSPSSNVANATPRTVPSAVRSLTAAPGASGQVRLSWLLPAGNGGAAISDYIIQRSTTGTSGWATINDGVRTTTSYVVGGLTNGVRYYFRVLARNAAGNGAPSNVANAVPRTLPSAPALRVAPKSGGATLTWTAPATGGSPITRYVIQRSASATTGWTTINPSVPAASRSYVATGLHNGTRYYFRMAAVNAAGTGPWSPAVNTVPR